jgi:hypothetical protein
MVIGRTKGPPHIAETLSLRCDCGSTKVFAVAPGDAGIAWEEITLRRQKRVRAWCEPCWSKKFG